MPNIAILALFYALSENSMVFSCPEYLATMILGNLFLSFPPELRAPKFDFGTARDHQYTGLDMASAQGGEAADGEIQRAKKLTTDLQVKQANDFFFAPPNKVSYFSRIWKSVCLFLKKNAAAAAVAAAATAAGTKQQHQLAAVIPLLLVFLLLFNLIASRYQMFLSPFLSMYLPPSPGPRVRHRGHEPLQGGRHARGGNKESTGEKTQKLKLSHKRNLLFFLFRIIYL